MPRQVRLEIDRKDDSGNCSGGLCFSMEVDDSITVGEFLEQAKQEARKICQGRGEEFVGVGIIKIE